MHPAAGGDLPPCPALPWPTAAAPAQGGDQAGWAAGGRAAQGRVVPRRQGVPGAGRHGAGARRWRGGPRSGWARRRTAPCFCCHGGEGAKRRSAEAAAEQLQPAVRLQLDGRLPRLHLDDMPGSRTSRRRLKQQHAPAGSGAAAAVVQAGASAAAGPAAGSTPAALTRRRKSAASPSPRQAASSVVSGHVASEAALSYAAAQDPPPPSPALRPRGPLVARPGQQPSHAALDGGNGAAAGRPEHRGTARPGLPPPPHTHTRPPPHQQAAAGEPGPSAAPVSPHATPRRQALLLRHKSLLGSSLAARREAHFPPAPLRQAASRAHWARTQPGAFYSE
jgi:hypothetical protein